MINIEQVGNLCKISYFNQEGDISFKEISLSDDDLFEWSESKIKESNNKTWNGIKVIKKSKKNLSKYRLFEIINNLDKSIQDEIFEFNMPKKFFISIKTESQNGIPSCKNPKEAILTITVLSASTNTIIVLGQKDLSKDAIQSIETKINNYCKEFNQIYKFKYKKFDSEYDMLYSFFEILCQKMPLITGWNIMEFDWYYLMMRGKKLGININIVSPTKILFDQIKPMHRLVLDYMNLFNMWDTSIKVKENLTLDWIAKKILGKGKIKNKLTQTQLYSNDFINFVFYNIIDTLLVKLIDDKYDLIRPFLTLANITKVSYYDSFSMINMVESCCVKQAQKKGFVILPNKKNKKETFKGGYIMEPIKNLYENIAAFDCRAMYPSIIMQWNISPDTKCSDFDKNCTKTINGFNFKQNEDGIFKMFIKDIYDQRLEANKLSIEYRSDIEILKKYIN